MCGIAGVVITAPGSIPDGTVERMTGLIRHRGPDDSGFYRDPWAWLGHRRLSIIDLSGGHQPMTNEAGNLWITYNGEIFNHAALRPDLERAGHQYQSHCDTETILHAYEQYGPDCVTRFRGMFAFAIWDQATRTLYCARDRLGIKPFYYFWNGRVFAFASEIKALLEHPDISARFDESVLPEYLGFGYISDERTMFANIRKLMPGHYLILRADSGQLDIRQYWDVPVPNGAATPERAVSGVGERTSADWIRECRQRLEETVRMRLMSDVPLGMFLSGGVDSSAIAALMKRMFTGPVKTFSVGYREAQYSELSYAAQVARAIGTEHHEIVVGMEDFFQALPRLIWHEDEPITWPSSVSLYFVSKLAAEQVKVVLTGEGSDELFGGYERYRWNLLNQKALRAWQWLPGVLRRGIRSGVATSSLLSGNLRRRLRHTFLGCEETLESLFLDNFYCAFGSGAPPVYANYLRHWSRHTQASALRRMLYADQKTYLVELLMKQDQMSMACSIESRVPFLDHPFVEFAMRVPDHLKIRKQTQKYILKKAVEDLLPADIIYRKKMGFPTPIRRWLRSPEAEPLLAALLDKDSFVAAYLDPEEITRLVERNRNDVEDGTDRLWCLLNLQIWGDLFVTGKRDRSWEAVSTAL